MPPWVTQSAKLALLVLAAEARSNPAGLLRGRALLEMAGALRILYGPLPGAVRTLPSLKTRDKDGFTCEPIAICRGTRNGHPRR
jgi:hypothetical protein